jgi:hypothetical protein
MMRTRRLPGRLAEASILAPASTAIRIDRRTDEVRAERDVAGRRLARVVVRIAAGVAVQLRGALQCNAAFAIEPDIAALDAGGVDGAANDDEAAIGGELDRARFQNLPGGKHDVPAAGADIEAGREAVVDDAVVYADQIDGAVDVEREAAALPWGAAEPDQHCGAQIDPAIGGGELEIACIARASANREQGIAERNAAGA